MSEIILKGLKTQINPKPIHLPLFDLNITFKANWTYKWSNRLQIIHCSAHNVKNGTSFMYGQFVNLTVIIISYRLKIIDHPMNKVADK